MLQFLTDEQGKKTGVVLSLEEYRHLTSLAKDPDLLPNLSQTELEALAESNLAPHDQARLDHLLAQNNADGLSSKEESELDRLIGWVDQLNILKSRAKYTLAQYQEPIAV